MKILFIILLVLGGLYLILFYVWPMCDRFYLMRLSERDLEAYLIKVYRYYKNHPREFRDEHVKQFIELTSYSIDFWKQVKLDVLEELMTEKDNQKLAFLQKSLAYCTQKIDFWYDAQTVLENEIERREYFNSFKN